MSFNVVRCDEVVPQPWKNGGGVTRELLTWPTREDWLVRISVADIEKDGPFSAFPGIKRTITVLTGEGIWLDEPFNIDLRPKDPPFTFSGDLAPECKLLRGPTRDLNAMFNEAKGVGRLQRWRTGYESKLKWVSFEFDDNPPTLLGVFTLAAATLRTRRELWTLPPMSLAWTVAPIPDMQLLSSPQAWAFRYTSDQ
jgi:uncharacterized protein